jgi:signal transduction histidine kinase
MKGLSSWVWWTATISIAILLALLALSGYRQFVRWHWIAAVVLLILFFCFICLLYKKEKELEETVVRERNFVSLVSHQLRIPLNELSWMLETVLETGAGAMNEERATTVQEIRSIVKNSIKLINDLLDVSRLERGVVKLTCEEALLLQLVDEAIKPLARTANEKGVRFTVKIPEKMTVFVDQQKAVEAIRNILDNAVKYGAKTDQLIEIGGRETEGFRTLTIRDHGPGIPKDIQARLFDKASAFSKKGTDKGTGLGLYLTKQFIERMGGDVSFASTPEGTTFSVSFTTERSECTDEDDMK